MTLHSGMSFMSPYERPRSPVPFDGDDHAGIRKVRDTREPNSERDDGPGGSDGAG